MGLGKKPANCLNLLLSLENCDENVFFRITVCTLHNDRQAFCNGINSKSTTNAQEQCYNITMELSWLLVTMLQFYNGVAYAYAQ